MRSNTLTRVSNNPGAVQERSNLSLCCRERAWRRVTLCSDGSSVRAKFAKGFVFR